MIVAPLRPFPVVSSGPLFPVFRLTPYRSRSSVIVKCPRREWAQFIPWRKPSKTAVDLFTGLIFCECGEKMAVPSNSPKYICRGCRNKIRVEDLDAVFQEQLHGLFLSEEEVQAYFEQADSTLKGKRELVSTLREEESKVRTEMDKTYRLYLDGPISFHQPLSFLCNTPN